MLLDAIPTRTVRSTTDWSTTDKDGSSTKLILWSRTMVDRQGTDDNPRTGCELVRTLSGTCATST